jgi:hypothetical protein
MWLVLVPGTPTAQLREGTPYREATGLESCEILPHIDMWTINAAMSPLIERMRKASSAVYLATDKTVADDISGMLTTAAASLEAAERYYCAVEAAMV